jgi:hypothetical protein
VARKRKARLGEELTRDEISASAARALRACKGFDEDCQEACREGVKAAEAEMKKYLKPEKHEVGNQKIKIIRER